MATARSAHAKTVKLKRELYQDVNSTRPVKSLQKTINFKAIWKSPQALSQICPPGSPPELQMKYFESCTLMGAK